MRSERNKGANNRKDREKKNNETLDQLTKFQNAVFSMDMCTAYSVQCAQCTCILHRFYLKYLLAALKYQMKRKNGLGGNYSPREEHVTTIRYSVNGWIIRNICTSKSIRNEMTNILERSPNEEKGSSKWRSCF